MHYQYLNLNPARLDTGDCVVRGISLLMNQSWGWTYLMIGLQGFLMYRMVACLEDLMGEAKNEYEAQMISDVIRYAQNGQ